MKVDSVADFEAAFVVDKVMGRNFERVMKQAWATI
jgi:hypothetical protein